MYSFSDVRSTTNYSQFKLVEGNRLVNPQNVDKIKKSILTKDKLAANPIIVTQNLSVLDGQHRLKAAESLKKKIYYIVDQKGTDEDIIIYNASTRVNWSLSNFIRYHTIKGELEYERLDELIRLAYQYKRFLNPLIVALNILCYPDEEQLKNKLKDGSFKISENFSLAEEFVRDTYPRINQVNEAVKMLKKTRCETLFFKPSYLSCIAYCFKNMKKYQYEELWACILNRADVFGDISNMDDVMNVLERVYNLGKKKNRLDFKHIRPHLLKQKRWRI